VELDESSGKPIFANTFAIDNPTLVKIRKLIVTKVQFIFRMFYTSRYLPQQSRLCLAIARTATRERERAIIGIITTSGVMLNGSYREHCARKL